MQFFIGFKFLFKTFSLKNWKQKLDVNLVSLYLLQFFSSLQKKGLSGPNHSFSDSHHSIEKFLPDKFSISPTP